jgi:hypothetical protein
MTHSHADRRENNSMPTARLKRTGPIGFATAAFLLSVSLAACDLGTGNAASSGGSAPVSTDSSAQTTSPAVSGTPAQAAATDESGIPASALLQPPDVRGADAEPLAKGELDYVRPLRPCGADPYPSDGSRREAVAVRYVLEPAQRGDAPSVVAEFVGLHAPGGAAAQFDEIDDALQRCPGGLAEGERRWTVLGMGVAGDESVLLRIDQQVKYGDEEPETVSHYAALARVDDVIVVVTDLGWEKTGGSAELVRDLMGKAVPRAGTIN